jgi:hypothetical protein
MAGQDKGSAFVYHFPSAAGAKGWVVVVQINTAYCSLFVTI